MESGLTEASPLLRELTWRGLIADRSTGVDARLARGPISAYVGFDASARSLHVGNLVQGFVLTHLQRSGGTPYIIVGGGTGMIGDPSGKSSERNLLDDEQIRANSAAIQKQLERFVDFSPGPNQAQMVDNREWLADWKLLDFLRDIGKHFSVPYMLAKDSVQARLGAGMSFTEFSYMTLQSADFLWLFQNRGVEMQMGGADQWGNITAGLELIRRVVGREEGEEPPAFAMCSPLLLTRDGKKMGKSENGAIFLDPWMTSPYEFYQYWLSDDDALVIQHLKWLTLMDQQTITRHEGAHAARPEAREAQRALAGDLTSRVHGEETARLQAEIAERQERKQELSEEQLRHLLTYAEKLRRVETTDPIEFLVSNRIASGRSDATRKLELGVYVNGVRLEADGDVSPSREGMILIRVGARHWGVDVTTFASEVTDPRLAELRDVLGHYDVLARRRGVSGIPLDQALLQFIVPLVKAFGGHIQNVRKPGEVSPDLVATTAAGDVVVVELKKLGRPVGTQEQLLQLRQLLTVRGARFGVLTSFDETVTMEFRHGDVAVNRRISRAAYEEEWNIVSSLPDPFEAFLTVTSTRREP